MIATNSLPWCFNGFRDGHSAIYSASYKAILESKFFSPLGDGFCLPFIFNRPIILFVSALSFACCPSNVSGLVSGIVVNSVDAELSLWFRAWSKSGHHVVAKRDELLPFFAYSYAAFKISVGLLIIRRASPIHVNPSGVEVRSLSWIFVLPVLRKSGAGAFNLPASTTLNRLEVMPLVVRGFTALTKALPDGVSLIIKSVKPDYREAMEFLPKVALNMRRYFHSLIKCGYPQIVNIYA